jgi:hypothetical protein
MAANDQGQGDGNSAVRAVLGVLAIITFATAILCLVLFVVLA